MSDSAASGGIRPILGWRVGGLGRVVIGAGACADWDAAGCSRHVA